MRSLLFVLLAACASSPPPPPAAAPPAPASPAPATLTADERRDLATRGRAAYDREDWQTCASLLERAEEWYDAACCHARAGRTDAAFAQLTRAIDGGFRNIAHLERDTDLTTLHADARWQAAVAAATAKRDAYRASINGELFDLYTADQADRAGGFEAIDWKVVSARDEARRKRVDEILAAGAAKAADDYYHAAMVFQHGMTADEIRRAHELAKQAVALDPKHDAAKWLAAASEDRVLMHENKPQKYGTQFQKRDGVWILYPVDPSVTDEERARWNVPPLAAAKARAEKMNAR